MNKKNLSCLNLHLLAYCLEDFFSGYALNKLGFEEENLKCETSHSYIFLSENNLHVSSITSRPTELLTRPKDIQ